MISCWYCTSAKMISPFYIIFALSQKVWFFSVKLTKKRAYETKQKKNIYSHIIKGLLHWYQWILSLVVISTDAHKLASFDIPTWDNIHRYQCNNPILLAHAMLNIYIFIAIVFDGTSIFVAVISRCKPFTSHMIYSVSWGRATSTPAYNILCLLTFMWSTYRHDVKHGSAAS